MQPVVIKLGGRAAEADTLIRDMASEIMALKSDGLSVLIVHGGGTAISSLQKQLGAESVFADGLRQTSPWDMDIVDMALRGLVNTSLVRRLSSHGLHAWGLSGADGSLLSAHNVQGGAMNNRTGTVASVDPRPIHVLWEAGYLPVCAPVASTPAGVGININADQAALALAGTLKAANLVFVSDISGILSDGRPLSRLYCQDVEKTIKAGTITGGMIPKVRSAVEAVQGGVGAVSIGDYTGLHDLGSLLEGRRGTQIVSGPE